MQTTDIAIIGLACRFSGADNPREFWHLLRDGREVREPLPDVADFDADFFNLSPREACAMDPRQRLALELTWELLEDASIIPETVRGEPIAVYLAAMNDDYALLTLRETAEAVDQHSFAGISRAIIANRVSYFFGLQGASVTLDTGQSSSLVAVHLACESLRTGASGLAIAGGVHLNLVAETAILETEFGAISPSGRTYAFDERADGYVRGDGGALVLLKPLDAAVHDGDRIYAVIRGSAIGNGGGPGLTVPSATAQADVIRRALAAARLGIDQVDYVEAHGTGTQVGDRVEATALGEVFAGRRHAPVSVGSVKTNIGHTGATAGIAGLIKAVLSVQHSEIPPSLNFVRAAAGLDLETLGLHVNTTLTQWTAGRPRRAGVSSFGMGGTNAHVVIEQAPVAESPIAADVSDLTVPWVLSARSAEGLAGQARRLAAHAGDFGIVDVGWSLVTTRSIFDHRAVVVGGDRERMMAALTALAAGEPDAGVSVGRARPLGRTVFVFPGQGSQYLGMGRQLYQRFTAFAQAFDTAVDVLDTHLRLPLRQVIWGSDAALLESTEFAQPGLFAVQVALAALLRDWGITPDFVLGHSVGEIVAAQVAGVLTLADAARVVAVRGRLMAGLPAGGAMVAVAASEADVARLLGDDVSLAAVNAPDSVVLSGPGAALDNVVDQLAAAGRRTRRLAVSHAFHSVLMDPMLDEFARMLADVHASPPRIDLVSNVSGRLATTGYGSPEYWVEHVRRPVRFADGLRTAAESGAGVFVEVGPGAGLVAGQDVSVATLAKDRPEVDAVLAAVGRLFTAGNEVNWPAVFAGVIGRRVELPTYSFARQRFWIGSRDVTATGTIMTPRLQALEPQERHRQLVELVCLHSAAVLGHSGKHAIDADRAFQDLGFNSMTGVELRNRLHTEKALAGLPLTRTLIFDYPTPRALAEHLEELLSRRDSTASDDEELLSLIRNVPLSELRRTGLLDKLLRLAGQPETPTSEPSVSDDLIDSLSADALIALALHPERNNDENHEIPPSDADYSS